MKKVGTISCAIGFILLGIWMIINMNHPDTGRELIKWWPVFIIMVGLEILYFTMKKSEDQHLRISALIFPLIILFFLTSTLTNFSYNLGKNGNWFNFDSFWDAKDSPVKFLDNSHWKSIDSRISLQPDGTKLYFEARNGDIRVEKTKDYKLTIDSKIYVEENNSWRKYDINPIQTSDGITIKILEDQIKAVKATIYVPDGYSISLKGSNLQIKSNDDVKLSSINLEINNGNVDLKGDIPSIYTRIGNGKADIENILCNDIDISVQNGAVHLSTKDENLSINTDINWGPCSINNEKRVNAGISRVIGNGNGKVKMKVNNGVITINSGV